MLYLLAENPPEMFHFPFAPSLRLTFVTACYLMPSLTDVTGPEMKNV